MIVFELLSDTHLKVYRDCRIVYDSHDPNVTRHYHDPAAEALEARARGIALKELAESHY